MPTPTTTFPSSLAALVRTAPGRPLVTFYDDATGERQELSVATYANWVAKTAGLCQDELDLTRGDRVLLDLPTHWLGAVWLGAALTLGLVVVTGPSAGQVDLVVSGPDTLASYAEASDTPVLALALTPMAGRFREPLPDGVTDFAAVVLGQPDAFTADDPPGADDPAWVAAPPRGAVSQAGLVAEATTSRVVGRGGRLLTDVNPCTRDGAATLLASVALDASTVWVRHPDPAGWDARAAQERVTAQLRA